MPEALFSDQDNNRFPISMYDKDRVIKGEAKLYTDAYFRNLSDLTQQGVSSSSRGRRCRCGGYHSSRIDCLGGSNPMAESTPNLFGRSTYGSNTPAERLFSKNHERDTVYTSILDNKNTWSVEEYLGDKMTDEVNLSF